MKCWHKICIGNLLTQSGCSCCCEFGAVIRINLVATLAHGGYHAGTSPVLHYWRKFGINSDTKVGTIFYAYDYYIWKFIVTPTANFFCLTYLRILKHISRYSFFQAVSQNKTCWLAMFFFFADFCIYLIGILLKSGQSLWESIKLNCEWSFQCFNHQPSF